MSLEVYNVFHKRTLFLHIYFFAQFISQTWLSWKRLYFSMTVPRRFFCHGSFFCYSSSLNVCVAYIFLFWIAIWPLCGKATLRLAFPLVMFPLGSSYFVFVFLSLWCLCWEVWNNCIGSWLLPSLLFLINRNIEICLWNKLCKNIMFLLLHRAIWGWDSTVTSIHMKRSSLENNQTEISLVKQTKVILSLLVLRKYESSTSEYDWLFLRGKSSQGCL